MKIFHTISAVFLLCFTLCAHCKETETGLGTVSETKCLRILILGGTTFLGPHLTNELLSRGHKVSHFNRGSDCCFSFPEVEKLQGNRDGDLKALKGRTWDAVIDTSGYLPRVVDSSSKILAGNTSHYTFISTISVYDFHQLHINESSSLVKLDGNNDEKITDITYGPFKADCEKVIQSYFPANSLIIRPGLIVGPSDPSDRFTYWVRRIVEGGEVLIPNSPKQNVQFIDVRDLVKWIVTMVEDREVGIYNATGPKEELSFEKFIIACGQFAKKKVDFIRADELFLIDHHIDTWNKLPLWLGRKNNMVGLFSVDSQKAHDKGLLYRPLSETILATLNWDDKRVNKEMKVGLSREEERILVKEFCKP